MTEATENDRVDRRTRRRVPVLGAVVACLLLFASVTLWVRVADPFNPYRPGSTHRASIHNAEGCLNSWTVDLNSGSGHYSFHNGVSQDDDRGVPTDWDPKGVDGTLHILHDWSPSGTDAVFEAGGQEIHLTGGSDHKPHFIAEGCVIL